MTKFGYMLALTAFSILATAAGEGRAMAPADDRQALLHKLDQAESLRAVKRLEIAQAQFIQYRLWDDVEQLYAHDAEAIFGEEHFRGRAAIGRQWEAFMGDLPAGPADEMLSVELAMTPVVTMAPDGNHARGRWHVVTMSGRYGGEAAWTGGIMENEYVREGGVWRIHRLHYYPQFAGPYDHGWTNVTDDLGVVPYHYTPEQAGQPIPALQGPARPDATSDAGQAPDDTAAAVRIAALNAEDDVRNLQNIYGYYVDRKMWDDVGDLYETDGTLEIAGVGQWVGATSIRRGLERDGPPDLREGEVNDRLQLNMIVTILPDGNAAHARGLEFSMLGRNGDDAFWTIATFENDYIRRDGKWRIAHMRIYPQMRTDYYAGWAKSWLPEPQPDAAFAPDRPAPALRGKQLPAFRIVHPTTGRSISYPADAMPVPVSNGLPSAALAVQPRLADARHGLATAIGYDAVENISSAFGNWLDDFEWASFAALFTIDGVRLSPAAGYYVGRERIRAIQEARYGPLRKPRRSIPVHLRTQPVIDIDGDERSARLRTRLLQFNSNFGRPGSMTSGMYEDTLRVEDGVWRFSEALIRHIWRSPGYAEGWARVPPDFGQNGAPSPAELLKKFPPDRPLDDDGYATFPKVGRMCFHYAHPVTGRRSASAPTSGCSTLSPS